MLELEWFLILDNYFNLFHKVEYYMLYSSSAQSQHNIKDDLQIFLEMFYHLVVFGITHMLICAHTHTHTHIYIYMYAETNTHTQF